MKNKCVASFLGIVANLGSTIPITFSLQQLVVLFAHCTMSTPSPKSPTGRRPVMSSNNTTPKLYTSLFSSTLRVYAYSVTRIKQELLKSTYISIIKSIYIYIYIELHISNDVAKWSKVFMVPTKAKKKAKRVIVDGALYT